MTITIEPTDFGQDIVDSISPFLGAFGLLDANGNLDIDDWSMEKALGVFSTFERTELILNTISGFVASPNYVLREKSTGLIVEPGDLPPAETREEEWFPVYQGDGWSVNLTVVHDELTGSLPLPFTDAPHSIELGIGLHVDTELNLTNPLVISGHLGIPIVRVKNVESSPGSHTYTITTDGIPDVEYHPLIWCDPSAPEYSGDQTELFRIALSAKLRPETGRFNSSAPSAAAIALRAAFGKESSSGADGLAASLSLLDFIARENDDSNTLEIDLVGLVSGGLSGILDSIIPALVEMLPEGAERFADNLLPMLGLLDTDWSSYPEFTDGDSYESGQIVQYDGYYYEVMNNQATAAASGLGPSHTTGQQTVWDVDLEYVSITLPSWPRLDLIALIGDLDDLDAAWTRIRTWLLELTTPEVATQWATHLYTLIFDGTPPFGTIEGACTIDDPISLKLIDIAGVSAQLLIALWTDTDGTRMLDIGLRVSAEHEFGASTVEVEGGMTVWLASVPLTGGRSIMFIPELLADFLIGKPPNLLSLTAVPNTPPTASSPLAGLALVIEKARLGISFPRGADVEPIAELLNVTIGTEDYPVIDLTSGASIMDAISGALGGVLDIISDTLAENDVLQWLGSLVGLVSPRDDSTEGSFRTEWEDDSGVDLRLDIMRMIQDPLDELTDYYARLLETQIDPYGQGPVTAWVYVQEALVLLINTALAGPMKIDKPAMPTSQIMVLGDGTALNPWRTMIGRDGDIPGINLFTYVEDTDQIGVNRLTFGLGCLVSLLQLKRDLHLETNLDVSLLGLNIAEVATPDVPAEAQLLPKIDITIKLHDAIGDPPNQIVIAKRGRGFSFTIDGISLGCRWIRGDGFALRASVHAPRIGSIAPDFGDMISQLSNPSRIGELWWDGSRLFIEGRENIVYPDLNNFIGSSDDPPDESILLQPVDDNDPGLPLTVSWDYFGLSCPEIGFDTKDGLFGLISRNSNTNALIDLQTGEELYENEGVQMLVSQVLAIKGGQWGFFLSTFLRLHPHLIYLDVVNLIERENAELIIPENNPFSWPDSWIGYHPKGRAKLGLGPFSLPYDWPQIDWKDLVNQPFDTLKQFLISVLSGVSGGGEPYAYSTFRWITGLFHGLIPDLGEPCLGWQMEEKEDGKRYVTIPEIPLTISGEGTFENPWSVKLAVENNDQLSFLFWLGPDGPNYPSQLDAIMTAENREAFSALQSEIVDILEISQLGQSNWPEIAADILIRLSSFSPKVRMNLGDTSRGRLAEDLHEFNNFLFNSDGLTSLNSQLAVLEPDISGPQITIPLSPITESLSNPEIISDIILQITESVPNNWSPVDGSSSSGNHEVLLVSDYSTIAGWSDVVSALDTHYSTNTTPDLWNTGDNLANFLPQSGIVIALLDGVNIDEYTAQIRCLADCMLDQSSTISIIAHGLTGSAAVSVTEGQGILVAEYLGFGHQYQANYNYTGSANSDNYIYHIGSDGIGRAYWLISDGTSPSGLGPEEESGVLQAFGSGSLEFHYAGRYIGQYTPHNNYSKDDLFTYIDSSNIIHMFQVTQSGSGVIGYVPPTIGAASCVFGRDLDETHIFSLMTVNSPHNGIGDIRHQLLENPLEISTEYTSKLDDWPNNTFQQGDVTKHTDSDGVCRYYVVDVAGQTEWDENPIHTSGTLQMGVGSNAPHLRYLATENAYPPLNELRIRRTFHLLQSLGLSTHENPLTDPLDFSEGTVFESGQVIRHPNGDGESCLYFVKESGSVDSGTGITPDDTVLTAQILDANGLVVEFLYQEQSHSRTLTLHQLAELSDVVSKAHMIVNEEVQS